MNRSRRLSPGTEIRFPSPSAPGGVRTGRVVRTTATRVLVAYTFKGGREARPKWVTLRDLALVDCLPPGAEGRLIESGAYGVVLRIVERDEDGHGMWVRWHLSGTESYVRPGRMERVVPREDSDGSRRRRAP